MTHTSHPFKKSSFRKLTAKRKIANVKKFDLQKISYIFSVRYLTQHSQKFLGGQNMIDTSQVEVPILTEQFVTLFSKSLRGILGGQAYVALYDLVDKQKTKTTKLLAQIVAKEAKHLATKAFTVAYPVTDVWATTYISTAEMKKRFFTHAMEGLQFGAFLQHISNEKVGQTLLDGISLSDEVIKSASEITESCMELFTNAITTGNTGTEIHTKKNDNAGEDNSNRHGITEGRSEVSSTDQAHRTQGTPQTGTQSSKAPCAHTT